MPSLLNKIKEILNGPMGGHIILAAIVAICVFMGIISIMYLGKNNPVEKVAEEIIKIETGKDINLSDQFP